MPIHCKLNGICVNLQNNFKYSSACFYNKSIQNFEFLSELDDDNKIFNISISDWW